MTATAPPDGDTRIRRPIAVVVSRFPIVTDTFALHEIEELERHGQPVILVPLARHRSPAADPAARTWIERALFTPWMSVAIVRATVRTLVSRPLVFLRALLWLLRSALHPRVLARSLALLPKTCYLAGSLAAEGVGLVHAQSADDPATAARIISLLTGIPFSFTAHGNDIYVNRSLLRAKVREASFVRSVSKFNRELLGTLYPRESAGKVEVVRTGIRLPEISPIARNDVPRLVAVGALEPRKGFPFLIDACRILTEGGLRLRCEIIGDGPLRHTLRNAVRRNALHDRLRVDGELPPAEVARQLRDADLFVLPSVIAADRAMDGLPVALLEAMAMGRVVIASAISGIPEVVTEGTTGFLVDPGNPRTLANTIRILLTDRSLRERVGQNARAAIAIAFDITTCTRTLLEHFDRHRLPADASVAAAVRTLPQENAAYGLRRVRRSIDSVVYELAVPNGTRAYDVILKQHLSRPGESRTAASRAVEEFETLRRLGSWFASPLGVPRPIHVDEEAGTLVMSRVPGVPLTKLIREARDGHRVDADVLRGAVRGAGTWLHRFQAMERRNGAEALDAIAQSALAAAEAGGYERIARRIRELHATLRRREVAAVPHHGDFWPGNVFVAGDGVQVIDFEGSGLSLPAHDVAYFFLHVSLYFRLRNEAWLDELRDAFFAGYTSALDPAESELCRLAASLHLATVHTSLPFIDRVVRRLIVRKELSR